MLAYPAIPKSLGTLPATVPPTFLVHADDDRLAAADNSVPFYLALKKLKRPAELHVYSSGRPRFRDQKDHGDVGRLARCTASLAEGACG